MNKTEQIKTLITEAEAENAEILSRISGPKLNIQATKINKDDTYSTIDITSFKNELQRIIVNNRRYYSTRDFSECLVQNTRLYNSIKNILDQWNATRNIDILFSQEVPRSILDDPSNATTYSPYRITIDKTHPEAFHFEWSLNEVLDTALSLTKFPEIKTTIQDIMRHEEERKERREAMLAELENSRYGGQNY